MAWLTEEEIAQYDLRYNDGLSEERYSPDQPRDEGGKWSGGSGGDYSGTGIGGGKGGPRPSYEPTAEDKKRWEAQGVKFFPAWTPKDQKKWEVHEPERVAANAKADVPKYAGEKEMAAWKAAHPEVVIASGLGHEQGDLKHYSDKQLEEHFRRMHGGSIELQPSRSALEAAHTSYHDRGTAQHVHTGGAPKPDTHFAAMPSFGKLDVPGYGEYQSDGHTGHPAGASGE